MGMPRPHRRTGVHPSHRARPLRRRVYAEPRVERLSRDTGPGLRPPVRARVPARPRRGEAGRDLPLEARRGGQLRRRERAPAKGAARKERQARRAHRRGLRVAHGRERPRAARLRVRDFRGARQTGWADAQQHPGLSAADRGSRRGDREHSRHRRGATFVHTGHEPPRVARGTVRRGLRRQRRAERQELEAAGPRRDRPNPHRHRLARLDRVRSHAVGRRARADHRRR